MPTAYVLINTEPEKMEEVIEKLRKVEGIAEAHMVYGVYDIVATVKSDTMDKLKEVVAWNIRRMESVRSTSTMIVMEGQ